MSEPKFTLSWQGYQNNLCNELGSFQQNEEFVDMTLAADGHFVKVHQIIISLVSPYLKEIIKSAQCKHPVIFLNKMSYRTLCSILEYIYTGEVTVAKEDFEELAEAGKELQIKGLDNLSTPTLERNSNLPQEPTFEHSSVPTTEFTKDEIKIDLQSNYSNHEIYLDDLDDPMIDDDDDNNTHNDRIKYNTKRSLDDTGKTRIHLEESVTPKRKTIDNAALTLPSKTPTIQFTVSNQGNLQLILNRFMYCMRYKRKDSSTDSSQSRRVWRCVDYNKLRCRASVLTKGNIVINRASAHTHPFHDKRIAMKVSQGAVFSAIMEAEQKGDSLKLKEAD